jgi:sec-independent protein translocase protein TatB
MLSIGWPEMLLVAAAALIIVGPRDLPALLKNIGNIVGKVRRMGNDFKAELNKVTALDEIKDIKSSITNPLTEVRSDIEGEFNKITEFGVEPTGKVKPKKKDATSVYDEIMEASSKTAAANYSSDAVKASMTAAVTTAAASNAAKAAEESDLLEEADEPVKAEPVKTEQKPKATPTKAKRKKPAKKTTKAKPPAKKAASTVKRKSS